MRIVDLSKPIQYNPADPKFMRIKIKHRLHGRARWLLRMLGLPFRYMPDDFAGWADDTITNMGVHSTTHIDAPWHYGPESGGQPAATIDQIDLKSCIGPGIVFDMTGKAEGDAITVDDLHQELDRIGATITEGTIALIRTGRDQFSGQPDFWQRGTGMSAAATEWLIDQGSTVMGIDQWGWDLPFRFHVERSKTESRSDLFWEAHRVGIRKPYWHMEQLTNLDKLPSTGFMVYVMPLKIVGASAAPARVIGVINDQD